MHSSVMAAVGAGLHFLDDAVAVAVTRGQGEQDVEFGGLKREPRVDFGLAVSHRPEQ